MPLALPNGTELAQYEAHNYYSEEQIEAYVADLVDGRRKDIRELAHRELDAIDATTRKKAEPWAPAEEAAPREAAEDRDPRSKWISPWEPRRPSAGLFPPPTPRPGRR